MNVALQYGRGEIEVELPPSVSVSVLEPRAVPGLADEREAFLEAIAAPTGGRPLRHRINPTDRVAVVIPDGTRAMPLARVLPWLFEALAPLPADRVVIINGTGTHRANTETELRRMLGDAIVDHYTIINHDAGDADSHVEVGRAPDGSPVRLERAYVEADKRIVLGFIEPHFWAGFSGGYKGVFPAIADMESIMNYHRVDVVGDPRSTWGRMVDNPTQDQVRHNGALAPVDFLLNVTLNRRKEITGFFCGDVDEAHAAGCRFARETAMVAVERPFPIVLTSNSGYPLDQNLYQAMKGVAAAAQIVEPGGLILLAAECVDGFPEHGMFKRVLFEEPDPAAILRRVETAERPFHDQWQIQATAQLMLKARIGLKSALAADDVRRAHLEPVDDLAARLLQEIERLGPEAAVAVLPEGPQTIPYLA